MTTPRVVAVTTSLVLLTAMVTGALLWLRANRTQHPSPIVTAEEANFPERITLSAESLRLAGLSIETVRLQPLRRTLRLFGEIESAPESVVDLNAPVAGRVLQIRARTGAAVQAGQVLAILDSPEVHRAQAAYTLATRKMQFAFADLQRRRNMAQLGTFDNPLFEDARRDMAQARAELRSAESEYRAALQAVESEQSSVRKARVALQLSQTRLERAKRLLNAQIIAQQEYDALYAETETAAADLQAAEARLDSAHADLSSAEARLQSARESFQIAQDKLRRSEQMLRGQYLSNREVADAEAHYQQARLEREAAEVELRLLQSKPGAGSLLRIVAPFDGRVVELRATVGETVTPEKPILRVINTSTLWAVFDLYPENLSLVRTGQRVRFQTDASPHTEYEAVIETIMPQLTHDVRVVKARARILNYRGTLKPGQFIEGKMTVTAGKNDLLLVPSEAVQRIEGKTCVFVQTTTPGEFQVRPVQVARQVDNLSEIRGGLRPGERIVVRNAFLLKGMLAGGGDH
ncbi:MAG: efflux RND transporter periplasmic adaptor subunit [bacterium]|nr:efflux RND transporter periplasmic adaptor subunit [bacterium]